jgi:outer membrane protein assembly factor BamB
VLEPAKLTGELIRLSDYPRVFAFSADGSILAAHGISSVHVVDVRSRKWSTTHKSNEAQVVLIHNDSLVIGNKTIALVSRESGKKVRSFKGHNATPNALALSADGKTLWSGGGGFTSTHDRFLFAFDASSGEQLYKVKPGKSAGAIGIAVLEDVVAVAAEDGHVRSFSAADGKALADVALAPAEEYGTPFGGVAPSRGRFVAAAVVDGACVVTWLSRDLGIEASARVVVKGAEDVSVGRPVVAAGYIVIPIRAVWVSDEAAVLVAVIDETTRALVSLRELAELDEPQACAVSIGGLIAWRNHEGVVIAPLVATESVSRVEPPVKAPPPPKKAEPRASAASSIAIAGSMSGGGPTRQAVFEADLSKAPSVLWARADYHSGADEFGGSVVVGEGIAVGSNAGWLCAHEAGTGKTRWSVQTSTARSWATGGIAIAHGTVFLATNQGLHAHDARTGESQWTARIAGAAGTPLVTDDLCLVAGAKGLHARALDKKGRKVWTFEVKDRIRTAPAYADGLAFVYADAQLLAIDLAAQELAWSAAASEPLRASPVIAGDFVVYLADTGLLAAADRRSGKQVWTTKIDWQAGGSSWACTSDTLLLRDDGFLQAYELQTGKPTWRSKAKRRKPYGIGSAGPIVVGQTVVSVTVEDTSSSSTFLSGLDLATGKVRWDLDLSVAHQAIAKEQAKSGSTYDGAWSWHCTPFVDAGILYAQVDAGIIALHSGK